MFRMMNHYLLKRKETRRRELYFTVPIIVPLGSQVRLIQNNNHSCGIDDHHKQSMMMTSNQYSPDDLITMEQVLEKWGDLDKIIATGEVIPVPNTVLSNYIAERIHSKEGSREWSMAWWKFRRQFTKQYASQIFAQYILALGNRFLHNIHIGVNNGCVFMSDMLPQMNIEGLYQIEEAVPFRLTPNIQHLIGDIGMEGVMIPSIMAIAQCLTEKRFEFEDYLGLFIRDEMALWYQSGNDATNEEIIIIQRTLQNVKLIHQRAVTLSCMKERETLSMDVLTMEQNSGKNNAGLAAQATVLLPLHQSIIDLVNCAVNPQKLSKMMPQWHPWM